MVSYQHISNACRALYQDGVIAYPTETVYGLGADPHSFKAVSRLLAVKNRSWEKGLILISASYQQLAPYIRISNDAILEKALNSWPGPYTWVFEATQRVPLWVRGKHSTIAVRVSPHPVTQALCSQFAGPIISTSANPAGFAATKRRIKVTQWFHNKIDYFVPGDSGPYSKPSEIRDARTGKLLRE